MSKLSKIISLFLIAIFTSLVAKSVYDQIFKQSIKTSTQKYINDTSVASYIKLDSSSTNLSVENTDLFSYQAVISIPKLNIEQGFLDENSNNVDKNIALIYPQTLNDIGNSSLVIAAHSGNSQKSYFHNLQLLEIGDKIYIYQNGIKYIFNVIKSYEIDKDGKLNVEEKSAKLYLTTCSENDKSKQLVVIANLESTSTY